MDPRLKALLARIEDGDFDAFGPLGDYLEHLGDPRADQARNVMTLEPPLIAQALCETRGPQPLDIEISDVESAIWVVGLFPLGMLAHVLALLGVAATRGQAASETSAESPTLGATIKEVEEAIRTRKLTEEMASAITFSRLLKRDHLLAELRNTPP